MDVKAKYAIAAGIIGLIPGGTFLLLALEGVMFYHICHRHRAPVLEEGIWFVLAIAGITFILKLAVETLHAILGLGQIVNAVVAFLVVYGLAHVVENYARRASGAQP